MHRREYIRHTLDNPDKLFDFEQLARLFSDNPEGLTYEQIMERFGWTYTRTGKAMHKLNHWLLGKPFILESEEVAGSKRRRFRVVARPVTPVTPRNAP